MNIPAIFDIFTRRKDRDGGWHAHTEFRMRRWVIDRWEYRPMTSMEYEDSMVDCYSPK